MEAERHTPPAFADYRLVTAEAALRDRQAALDALRMGYQNAPGLPLAEAF